MKELEKTYNPADIEDRLYQKWLDGKYFHAEVNRSKKPFTIVMPPPNITGQLHMGHALDNTMQDILIRYKRLQGYEALWQPGTDHAAIATEVKVIDKLKKEGVDKADLGRDGFLKECWKWRDEYGTRIVKQLHKLGSSADWDRERFTMDQGCSGAVLEVFVKLYEKGCIYKGSRIINWCPVCQTSISDAEVEHVEQNGFFWHINYPVVGEPGRFVEIATTRPETMLGDTAVAVNPEDERYQDIVGKMLKLPLTDREIPVIADPYVDKEFGTGCVKITPAHDPNDFEVGKRHNLEEIVILNDDATVNVSGPYFGMDRYEARKAIVADLEAQGLLVKVVPHSHNVGTHDRCKTTVEPMVKQQWFVKMEEMAKPAIEALKNGSLTFVPESFGKTYLHWLEGIRDWCISRQLWWGHRIPAYYCRECGKLVVSREAPHACPKCGCTSLKQDGDTLDTWFSSALWPFSTLGWPEKTEDLDYFYPTDVLVTAYDIIFFWVIRMVFSGLEQTGKLPFHTVLIHGLVRDSEGRKMSKSLGNGIDPLEVIDKYGADALRMALITGNAPGNDMRFYWERVENSRNFANKVWNASRFIMMNIEKAAQSGEVALDRLTMADKWIVSKVNTLTREVTENLDKYELGIALQKVYDFIWEEFCDWYIEMVKPRLYNEEDDTKAAAIWTLRHVLIQALKLLHPFMPFISEEIFCNLQEEEETIMVSQWPVYRDDWSFAKEEQSTETIKEAVRAIRGVRSSMNVPPSKKATVNVVSEDEGLLRIFEHSKSFFATLCYSGEVILQKNKDGIADDAVSAVIHRAVIYMPFADLVDIEKEIERLKGEEKRLAGELARSRGMLGNEKFVSRAPEAKIAEERAKLEKYEQMMEQVKLRLAQLQ
ncbi:valine--tRNA ligase [Enterocloster clostridioformis]|uniref:valine--tRNA ligase n=1 Tax=Enterocloster clostridioformis TaxID=1531 RepID=UPI00080C4DBA|nr:valine--tRNA ligase [Enterocloster clostridioformis]ANU50116.1 valine--tRNA ligase [Lachnoclostridium sp. YL32]NDO28389.1 valine--tRNA ligase [Enterocloster clostridioformis]OXE70820.1 valine--tRNA ligase [Enterocloster clostridioformis]QQR00983.1 valine--tRNA ligase [Enterocloster clostridioformis]